MADVKDALGNRMKMYEGFETSRTFIPLLPIYARIDGKCFSSFTRGMKRPYDEDMSNCMIETTKKLVEFSGARVGYSQSDEISLLWYVDNFETSHMFDAKIFKMTSVLAAYATSAFTFAALKHWPDTVEKMRPVFDCRVFQLPNKMEAANSFHWRCLDACKNAISMAARSMFSHKELQGKSSSEMQEMMWQTHGVNFANYPSFFKNGTFVVRRKVEKELTDDILAKIPVDKRPTGPIIRNVLATESLRFSRVTNKVGYLFDEEDAIFEKEPV